MARETQQIGEIEAVQRQRVNARLAEVVGSVWSIKTRLPFAQALHTYFDDLPIAWEKFTTDRQLYAVVPSVYGALSYATFQKTGEFPIDASLDTPDKSRNAIIEMADHPSFTKMLGELPISFQLNRAAPIYYAVRHLFHEEPNTPRVFVDLGAGPGYMLPSLADPNVFTNLLNRPAPGLYRLYGNSNIPIPIQSGHSVDRFPKDEAAVRAKAYSNDRVRSKIDTFFRNVDPNRFSHVEAELMDANAALYRVRASLGKHGNTHADIVIRSLVDYQVLDPTVLDYETLELLNESGYCIIVGEEMLDSYNRLSSSVSVYQKRNNKLHFIGMPFTISDDGIIITTDVDFFKGTNQGHFESASFSIP